MEPQNCPLKLRLDPVLSLRTAQNESCPCTWQHFKHLKAVIIASQIPFVQAKGPFLQLVQLPGATSYTIYTKVPLKVSQSDKETDM